MNKLNNTEGGGIKNVMACPGPQANIMSQYARIHNKLGVMLGPGVERESQVRRQYNVLTGMVVNF